MAKVTVLLNSVQDIAFDVEIGGEIRRLICNGSGHALKGLKQGILPEKGYGLTLDVDGELWDAVYKKYCGMKLFQNGLIKAVSNAKEEAAAKEEIGDKLNGKEPINPNKKLKK